MAFKYKIDIVSALKKAGYSTYRIRKEKLFSESTLTAFRSGDKLVSFENLDRVCKLLKCDIGDILYYCEGDVSEK